jgi:cytochrome c oxidase subunit 3
MPAIFTPPKIDPRDKLGEGDNGSGRRPPTDKRTGGGGEGDNWNDRPSGSRGPRERISQSRVGLGFGLAGIFMFFIALVSAFFATKGSGHFNPQGEWVYAWMPTAVPRILRLNTVILLFSSAAAEMARRSMFREQDIMDEWIGLGRPTSRRAALWLGATLLLGIAFLAGQWVAWHELAAQNIFFRSNPSSHFFYLITVAHAVHLFVGLSALVAALVGLRASRQFATRQVFVDTTVWYWHAMGALWLLLFILLEFGQ